MRELEDPRSRGARGLRGPSIRLSLGFGSGPDAEVAGSNPIGLSAQQGVCGASRPLPTPPGVFSLSKINKLSLLRKKNCCAVKIICLKRRPLCRLDELAPACLRRAEPQGLTAGTPLRASRDGGRSCSLAQGGGAGTSGPETPTTLPSRGGSRPSLPQP